MYQLTNTHINKERDTEANVICRGKKKNCVGGPNKRRFHYFEPKAPPKNWKLMKKHQPKKGREKQKQIKSGIQKKTWNKWIEILLWRGTTVPTHKLPNILYETKVRLPKKSLFELVLWVPWASLFRLLQGIKPRPCLDDPEILDNPIEFLPITAPECSCLHQFTLQLYFWNWIVSWTKQNNSIKSKNTFRKIKGTIGECYNNNKVY